MAIGQTYDLDDERVVEVSKEEYWKLGHEEGIRMQNNYPNEKEWRFFKRVEKEEKKEKKS